MNKSNSNTEGKSLEPRVAKLETGLEILTRDVQSLAMVVREQSHNIESEIQKLAVAVTQAAAPRKTEWPVLIATLMLVMAIGSAVFAPLNNAVSNNSSELKATQITLSQHIAQESHPVAAIRLNSIEARLNKAEANEAERNKAELDELRALRGKLMEQHIGK
jgi:hypothetical protein